MPTFLVLHSDTPDGVQPVWTELGRPTADDAEAAFATVTAGAIVGGRYDVLSTDGEYSVSVSINVTPNGEG